MMRDPAVHFMVSFPFRRLVLAAGALALLVGFQLHRAPSGHYRLELQVTQDGEDGCFYGSPWYSGAPEASRIDAPITFQTRYDYVDGCTWESTETLIPVGDGKFSYQYHERMLSCDEDSEPGYACDRAGIVTAVPIR